MANKPFLKGIAFSNLAGSSFSNYLRLLGSHKISPKYFWRALLNGFIAFILTILALGDKLVWLLVRKKIRKVQPPLFVLGHWRSGTTHLHNLLCLDKRAGYATTFQTVFPHMLFGFHKPMLWLMRLVMPKTRPVDNVVLDAENPQEEEFGLGNISEMSYYSWWYFPADWDKYIHNYLSLKTLSNADLERWKKIYLNFVKRALIYQSKFWFVSKNPPNTARIQVLLDLFPQARFIYIKRNPYEVFVSSQRFFKAILEPLQLQDISEADFNQQILKAYVALYDAYEEQKTLTGKNRLVEIEYSQFMQKELSYLQFIYAQLEIDLPPELVNTWRNTIGEKDHKTKTYDFSSDVIKLVNEALGERIEQMGYKKL